MTNSSKVEKIQTHFQALSSAATSLNTASDELAKSVGALDDALRKLNIGLTIWVTVSTWSEEERAGEDQIGYCKVDGKWGIALRYIWGGHALSLDTVDGLWLFNDAPRDLRLAGVDKIPELIEALGKEASETAKQVQEKTKQVRELAGVIEEMSSEPRRMERPKKTDNVGRVGLSSVQIAAILAGVQNQQKFLGELIAQASHWELDGAELVISFPAGKRAFAEMVTGSESLSKVKIVVGQVLGRPVRLSVRLEPSTAIDPTANNSKGGK